MSGTCPCSTRRFALSWHYRNGATPCEDARAQNRAYQRAYYEGTHTRVTYSRADLIAEVEALDGSPGEIAARLGLTPAAIEKAYRRAGRPDLARPFGRERRRQPAGRGSA